MRPISLDELGRARLQSATERQVLEAVFYEGVGSGSVSTTPNPELKLELILRIFVRRGAGIVGTIVIIVDGFGLVGIRRGRVFRVLRC